MNKNLGIQVLRGIAALMVFFSHALNMRIIDWVERLQETPLHFFWDGQCAVILFMVISGFFYYKPQFTWGGYVFGLKKKVARIYPLSIIVLLTAFILCNLQYPYDKELYSMWGNSFWNPQVSSLDLLKNMSLIVPCNTDILVPPIWYLFVEVRMFILMPLLIGLWVKRGMTLPFIIILLICFIPHLPTYIEYLPVYFIGSIARWLNDIHIDKLNRWVLTTCGVVGIFLLDIGNIYRGEIQMMVMNLIQALGASLILVWLYHAAFKNSIVSKVMVSLGDISYEFFLIHFVVLLSLRPLALSTPLYIVVSLVITLVLSRGLNSSVAFVVKAFK